MISTQEKIDTLRSKIRGTDKAYSVQRDTLIAEYKAKLANLERERLSAVTPMQAEIMEHERIISAYEAAAERLEQ